MAWFNQWALFWTTTAKSAEIIEEEKNRQVQSQLKKWLLPAGLVGILIIYNWSK